MKFRQLVCVVLLVGLAGVLFPALADAEPLRELGPEVRAADSGLFARVLERIEKLFAQLTSTFVAYEGATISPYG